MIMMSCAALTPVWTVNFLTPHLNLAVQLMFKSECMKRTPTQVITQDPCPRPCSRHRRH
jgi:hypothetical protein